MFRVVSQMHTQRIWPKEVHGEAFLLLFYVDHRAILADESFLLEIPVFEQIASCDFTLNLGSLRMSSMLFFLVILH